MTKKKSIFEKLGLVESSNELDFNQEDLIESMRQQSQEIEEYDAIEDTQAFHQFEDGTDFLTVLEAYDKVGLSNLDKSIFKVDDFGKHLPDNLPLETKRQSVIGILTASGLELGDLLEDAELRIQTLKGVLVATTDNTNEIITEKESEINDLLFKVDTLKQEIIDRNVAQERQDELVDEELTKINQILKFITSK